MTPEVLSNIFSDFMTVIPIAKQTNYPFGPPIPQKQNTQYIILRAKKSDSCFEFKSAT